MSDTETSSARYRVEVADPEQIIAVQQLRYRIFARELGARMPHEDEGLDRDEFDPHCQHLIVRDLTSGHIVASTRVLTEAGAARTGRFYSSGEFSLENILALPGRRVEIGRTCVDPAFRNGAVIATLWQGIGQLIGEQGVDYLFGCASVSLAEGREHAEAIIRQVMQKHLAPTARRVSPLHKLPRLDSCVDGMVPRMPPLLRTYVNLGAKACGEPCWDPDFGVADVFMLLDLRQLNPRFARHFLPSLTPAAVGSRVAWA
ncbi:MAG TPA: GNAT family N-acyltransferase [Gammaproteobacteria bacterium]|nr:GNAT family N-acyltransferase [Gammaproteobacteria bacterium]